jgi:hypothetical protein
MVRDMPHCWRARLDLPRGVTVTVLSATASVTSSVAVKLRAPLGPFTSMVWPETEADTPDGSSTGFFRYETSSPPSEHGAEHFAADIGRRAPRIRHHALGRRDDRHAQALTDLRDVLDAMA